MKKLSLTLLTLLATFPVFSFPDISKYEHIIQYTEIGEKSYVKTPPFYLFKSKCKGKVYLVGFDKETDYTILIDFNKDLLNSVANIYDNKTRELKISNVTSQYEMGYVFSFWLENDDIGRVVLANVDDEYTAVLQYVNSR